jgi:hypothetical protein
MKTLAPLLLVAVILAGCYISDLTASGVEPIEPLPWYRTAWARLETCTGGYRDFDAIAWYRFDRARLEGVKHELHGVHNRTQDWIYLRADRVGSPYSVSHEMIHALIGDRDHVRKSLWQECVLHDSNFHVD